MKWIDLNADIGEGFAFDSQLLSIATSVNICSGFHAGSPTLCQSLLQQARRMGVRAGLHIGFPDPGSMGRRQLSEGYPDTWVSSVVVQILESSQFAYIKPHGALYHWLAIDPVSTRTVWDALEEMERPFMGMAGTEHENQCRRRGIRLIKEGFADRGYDASGLLIPRGEAGAILDEPSLIRTQSLALVASVDSLCVHGDHAKAVETARLVKSCLIEAGIGVGA